MGLLGVDAAVPRIPAGVGEAILTATPGAWALGRRSTAGDPAGSTGEDRVEPPRWPPGVAGAYHRRVNPGSTTASYRALLALPSMSHIVASLFLSRTAQSMGGVALTLFTLAEFGSASLAGLVAFASFAPGILVSPIAGALLDRHGRVRLIGLDFLVAMSASIAIGVLSLGGWLSAELLVAIAVVTSLTMPLSMTGLRTLFPIIVPGTSGSAPTPSIRTPS